MKHCTRLSGQMPVVARGAYQWSPEEESHLEGCPDCRAEWRLVSAVLELADTSGWDPDIDAITNASLDRIRDAQASRHQGAPIKAAAAGLAAAAVLIVTAVQQLPVTAGPGASQGTELASLPVPGLEALGESQLQRLLEELDGPLLGDETDIAPPNLTALDSTGLAAVLSRLEEP